MTASYPPKEITCECGNKMISQQRSNWCRSCGKQLFYDAADTRKNRFNRIYITLVMVIFIGVVVYFFVEILLTPLLSLRQP